MRQQDDWAPPDTGGGYPWAQNRPAGQPVAPPLPPHWSGHRPSGLFPRGPVRPTYREPYPVRSGMVAAGFTAAALWMLLVGLMGDSVRWYGWLSLVAAAVAGAVIGVLARFGDRGAAVGAAVATGLALGVTMIVVAAKWLGGDWPLW